MLFILLTTKLATYNINKLCIEKIVITNKRKYNNVH